MSDHDKDTEERDESQNGQSDELEPRSEPLEAAHEPAEGPDSDESLEDDLAEAEDPESLEADPLASAEDAIDPELLEIGEKRRPPYRRVVIMVVVCALIGLMMYWFRLDLMYFFSPTDPIELGEAHEADLNEGMSNRYVSVEGIPYAPHNLNPSSRCSGTQGFPTYQRRFICTGSHSAVPLMGRPDHDLLIQRYIQRRLIVRFGMREGEADTGWQLASRALSGVSAVREVNRVPPSESEETSADEAELVVEYETQRHGTYDSVVRSIRFALESTVPGIRAIRIERYDTNPPGYFRGRMVRISDLGSRFASVAAYLNECTNYDVSESTWVVLDGTECAPGLYGLGPLCYGQQPRNYWPYLLLYILLTAILGLNLLLLGRFVRSLVASGREGS